MSRGFLTRRRRGGGLLIFLLALAATLIARRLLDATLLPTDASSSSLLMSTLAQASKPAPRFSLVDYCVGDAYDTLKPLVMYNRRAYAERHGYEVFSGSIDEYPLEPFVTPRAWLKPAYLYEIMNKSYNSSNATASVDWFVWMDCDALIARFDWSLDKILSDLQAHNDDHHVIVAQDPNTLFNTGVMLIRNHEWSHNLLKRMLQQSASDSTRHSKWWEQQALLDLYEANQHDEHQHVFITPQRAKLNAFRNPRRNEYEANTTFIWHRVNCRQQPECDEMSVDFFCATMPKLPSLFPDEICRDRASSDF